MNGALELVIEASSYKEKRMLLEMTEYEQTNITTGVVTKLYDSLLNKSYARFDEIEKTKGDIESYIGYQDTVDTLNAIEKLINDTKGVNVPPELQTIRQAINNIIRYKSDFVTSFKLERKLGKLIYTTVVASIIESTTLLLASSIEFVKNPIMGEVIIAKKLSTTGYLPIENLNKFNMSAGNGELSTVMRTVNTTDKDKLLGGIAVPFIAIGATIALIIIMREMVYYFYNMRQNVSDFLQLQKKFLEYNENEINLNKELDAEKKKQIKAKQKVLIQELDKLSDMVKIKYKSTEIATVTALKKEKESYSLNSIQKDINKKNVGELDGIRLL
jgi:hypothetical protein